MRIAILLAAGALALTVPSFAHAQDAPLPDSDERMAEVTDKLADPAFQAQAAAMTQVLLTAMLELPIGPLAEAMNEATGGDGPEIDPDARLRDIAPDAEYIPGEVAERLPRAMGAMSEMGDGMAAMLPALKAMAEHMRAAMERGADDR